MENKKKLLAVFMFLFACTAFIMHLCGCADFCVYADMAFRMLLLFYLLLYMKVK